MLCTSMLCILCCVHLCVCERERDRDRERERERDRERDTGGECPREYICEINVFPFI